MTLSLIDSLDFYSSIADVTGVYSIVGTGVTIKDKGKYGGKAVRVATTSDYLNVGTTGTGNITYIFQAWVMFAGFSNTNDFLKLSGSGDTYCSLRTSTTKRIKIVDADGSVVVESIDDVLSLDTYHYLEVKVYVHATLGAASVKIDGSTVATISNIKTYKGVSAPSQWELSAAGASHPVFWDDFLVINDQGAAWEIKDWIGQKYIHHLLPTADGTYNEWDHSSGSTSFNLVNDPLPGIHDGDARYINSSTIDEKATVTCGSLPDGATVDAVGVFIASKRNPECAQALLISGSTEDLKIISSGTGVYASDPSAIWQQDPDGGGQAWTKAAVDALEIGVKCITCPT
jgi:hypothetical protein